tara:strand:- start:1662 stop:1979 length:318 start_codon:yes stop_codon:yes gene_type:complete
MSFERITAKLTTAMTGSRDLALFTALPENGRRADKYVCGGASERASEVAQAHECERLFDAIHALVHRIEGGMSNAIYWDRRTGTGFARSYPYEEWALLAEEAVSE